MPSQDPTEVTQLLHRMHAGAADADADRLWRLVYEDLRSTAERLLRREQRSVTLHPTALVNEAYLRLVGPQGTTDFHSRRHFFGAALRAMRRLLVERGRAQAGRAARGQLTVTLDPSAPPATPDASADPLLLAEALDALEQQDARAAQVIMLRFFAGLSHEDIAELLELSVPTVKRDQAYARAWLYRELGPGS